MHLLPTRCSPAAAQYNPAYSQLNNKTELSLVTPHQRVPSHCSMTVTVAFCLIKFFVPTFWPRIFFYPSHQPTSSSPLSSRPPTSRPRSSYSFLTNHPDSAIKSNSLRPTNKQPQSMRYTRPSMTSPQLDYSLLPPSLLHHPHQPQISPRGSSTKSTFTSTLQFVVVFHHSLLSPWGTRIWFPCS